MNAEDRELLELAAKAAGVKDFVFCSETGAPFDAVGYWNPLDCDGDALRLAVNLRLYVSPNISGELAMVFGDKIRSYFEPYSPDPLAATRRAIVRAAAEIGQGMP